MKWMEIQSVLCSYLWYYHEITSTKMKFLVVAFALLACAYADVSELGYDYHQPAAPAPAPVVHEELSLPIAPAAPQNTYIPPPAPQPAPQPQNTYVPPPAPVVREEQTQSFEVSQPAPVAPQNTYIPPAASAPAPVEIEQPAEDGYRYRTVRRRVFRHRA